MDAKKLKQLLTLEQIIKLMEVLGADYLPDNGSNFLMYRTVCHCGDSHKLYLYKDSKEFHCYTNCGQMDIINVVQNVKKISVGQAIGFICKFFDIGTEYNLKVGFDNSYENPDLKILERMQYNKPTVDMSRDFRKLDEEVLTGFYKMYHPSFYNDGISVETLFKFGILYDIYNSRVIIPHRDEEGNLIAVRCRNLKEELVEAGMKYTPIVAGGKLLSAPTGKYFYGMYYNKDNIKKIKKVILVESEKAVMQLEDIMSNNIALALSSSSLSLVQVELLISLGVQEVIVALDKEFHEYGTKEEQLYAMKIRKGIIDKLTPYFTVSVVWDKHGLIGYKDSPTDKGSEIFWKLMSDRIKI